MVRRFVLLGMVLLLPFTSALGVIDRVLEEPKGGAHGDPAAMAATLRDVLGEELVRLSELATETLLEHRFQKYLHMGVFADTNLTP